MKQSEIRSIAFLGECMIELRQKRPHVFQQHYAGDTMNTAVYFARQSRGRDVRAACLTAVGTDALSEGMLAFLVSEGLDCRQVIRLEGKNPGLYLIHVDERGERRFQYWRRESAARAMLDDDRLLRALRAMDGVYLSGITLAILSEEARNRLLHALSGLKGSGLRIFFDDNYRPALWEDAGEARRWYRELLALSDVAFLTADDERRLFGVTSSDDILALHAERDVPEMVIRCGAGPALVRTEEGARVEIPAESVTDVVDTTAAGDAFSAAYLAARIGGRSAAESARAGHRLAAHVIRLPGAFGDPGSNHGSRHENH